MAVTVVVERASECDLPICKQDAGVRLSKCKVYNYGGEVQYCHCEKYKPSLCKASKITVIYRSNALVQRGITNYDMRGALHKALAENCDYYFNSHRHDKGNESCRATLRQWLL